MGQWFVCLSVAMATSEGKGYGTQSIISTFVEFLFVFLSMATCIQALNVNKSCTNFLSV